MRYTISLACASSLLCTALPAMAEVPRVVTDIAPVQSLAAQVMGDLGTPAVLLPKGGDAHDFQLRPSQASQLAEASLVIWVGPELTPWLDRALDGLSGGARLGLLAAPGTETRDFGDEGDDHGNEEGHADGHDHEAHAHSGTDPHAWLDPGNAQVWLTAIAAELARLDPANAASYAANAAAAAERITALDAGLAARLAPVQGKPFVVQHEAFGYFAAHYRLDVVDALTASDAAAPGAAHLHDLQAKLAAGQALCIFPETNHDPKLALAMADGTPVRIGGALDPEGAAVDPGPDAYAAILTGLTGTLLDCLATD